ncbi:GNAT family N-acetyltransferase [Deinococcus cavernae]|uniref:GNAT family N-acetyltransferase n=1 Tax=Deinococcus cavernae TaxID=2320857 RepID=A0A418V5R7_9DEIO|nr:GNAT family N-acetyltransferase [Deinococcus cavernae]RJF71456.1 GNAT family N-acetyltransferase [Deinococcus cavernae]
MTLTDQHIKIRQALPTDLPVVVDLLERTGLHTSSVTLDEGCTYWIADLDGRPAGCIGLEQGQGASLIRSTAVLPAMRSRGLGRALVLSALTHASLRGDRIVYLFSSEAGDYWKRYGFVPAEVGEIEAALPHAPQVVSGLTRGWIQQEQVWKHTLFQPQAQPPREPAT